MPPPEHSDSIPALLVVARYERFDWVEMQLAKNFILDTKLSMPGSLVVTWVMAAVIYRSVLMWMLLVWVSLSTLSLGCAT